MATPEATRASYGLLRDEIGTEIEVAMVRTMMALPKKAAVCASRLSAWCICATLMDVNGEMAWRSMTDATQVGPPVAESSFSVWWLTILTITFMVTGLVVLAIEKVKQRRHNAAIDAYVSRLDGRKEGMH